MPLLRVVTPTEYQPSLIRLIVVSPNGNRQIEAEEKETPVALIGMALAGFYKLGGMIETGTAYGLQVAADISFLWRGDKRTIRGAVVPLVGGPDLILPLGVLGD